MIHTKVSNPHVYSGLGQAGTPGIWGLREEDRKRNGQFITMSPPRFENLTTALQVDRQSCPITGSPHLPLII